MSSKDSFITGKKKGETSMTMPGQRRGGCAWKKFKRKKKVYYILRKRLLPVRILYIALYPVAPKRIYIYIYVQEL